MRKSPQVLTGQEASAGANRPGQGLAEVQCDGALHFARALPPADGAGMGVPFRGRRPRPPYFFAAKAYRCLAVRTYRVSSAIAGVAATRSPSSGFLATTSGLPAPAFRTVTAPASRDVR